MGLTLGYVYIGLPRIMKDSGKENGSYYLGFRV